MGIFTRTRQHQGKVGGIFYFVSVLSLIMLSVLSLGMIFRSFFISGIPEFSAVGLHFSLVFLGLFIGIVIRGRISVFFHELKHSIVSSLAGNKSKGMKIEEETGHFQYAYSKDTSHLNAFISLAPYTFPLFSLAVLPLVAILYSKDITLAKGLVSVALGIDLVLNVKDAGPYQTDFSEVRGGFFIGFVYMVCFNFVLAALISVVLVFGYTAFVNYGLWLISTFSAFLIEIRGAD